VIVGEVVVVSGGVVGNLRPGAARVTNAFSQGQKPSSRKPELGGYFRAPQWRAFAILIVSFFAYGSRAPIPTTYQKTVPHGLLVQSRKSRPLEICGARQAAVFSPDPGGVWGGTRMTTRPPRPMAGQTQVTHSDQETIYQLAATILLYLGENLDLDSRAQSELADRIVQAVR